MAIGSISFAGENGFGEGIHVADRFGVMGFDIIQPARDTDFFQVIRDFIRKENRGATEGTNRLGLAHAGYGMDGANMECRRWGQETAGVDFQGMLAHDGILAGYAGGVQTDLNFSAAPLR
jgi:hypothetical protein